MAQIAFRHLDPHDDADRVGQAVFSGIWKCIRCGLCSSVCPAQIDHVKLFTLLQDEAEARGMKPDSMV